MFDACDDGVCGDGVVYDFVACLSALKKIREDIVKVDNKYGCMKFELMWSGPPLIIQVTNCLTAICVLNSEIETAHGE